MAKKQPSIVELLKQGAANIARDEAKATSEGLANTAEQIINDKATSVTAVSEGGASLAGLTADTNVTGFTSHERILFKNFIRDQLIDQHGMDEKLVKAVLDRVAESETVAQALKKGNRLGSTKELRSLMDMLSKGLPEKGLSIESARSLAEELASKLKDPTVLTNVYSSIGGGHEIIHRAAALNRLARHAEAQGHALTEVQKASFGKALGRIEERFGSVTEVDLQKLLVTSDKVRSAATGLRGKAVADIADEVYAAEVDAMQTRALPKTVNKGLKIPLKSEAISRSLNESILTKERTYAEDFRALMEEAQSAETAARQQAKAYGGAARQVESILPPHDPAQFKGQEFPLALRKNLVQKPSAVLSDVAVSMPAKRTFAQTAKRALAGAAGFAAGEALFTGVPALFRERSHAQERTARKDEFQHQMRILGYDADPAVRRANIQQRMQDNTRAAEIVGIEQARQSMLQNSPVIHPEAMRDLMTPVPGAMVPGDTKI